MKHVGSKMEFSEERAQDVMRAYDEYVSSCDYICLADVYKKVPNMPSRRFWISVDRAMQVVSAMEHNENYLKGVSTLKREMYQEIYNRVSELKKANPNLSLRDLCFIVTEQPAPKFYLTAFSIQRIILRYKKQWIREKMKRLRLL